MYVKNLDTSVTKEQLEQKFGEFGTITSAVIATNEKEESKGFGFINFEKPEQAQKAVEVLNGSLINGKAVYVSAESEKIDLAVLKTVGMCSFLLCYGNNVSSIYSRICSWCIIPPVLSPWLPATL